MSYYYNPDQQIRSGVGSFSDSRYEDHRSSGPDIPLPIGSFNYNGYASSVADSTSPNVTVAPPSEALDSNKYSDAQRLHPYYQPGRPRSAMAEAISQADSEEDITVHRDRHHTSHYPVAYPHPQPAMGEVASQMSDEDVRARSNVASLSYYPPGHPQPALAGPASEREYDEDIRTRRRRPSRTHYEAGRAQPALAGFTSQMDSDEDIRMKAQTPSPWAPGGSVLRPQAAIAGFSSQPGSDDDMNGIDAAEANAGGVPPRPQSSSDGRRSSMGSWKLSINSRDIFITSRRKDLRRFNRGSRHQFGDIIHDLLAASLVPLTENKKDPKEIRDQGVEFLSSFSSDDAIWEVRVNGLPNRQARVIHGLTDNSRDPSVGLRFLRFRFPFVRFEWHIETPYSELRELYGNKSVQMKFLWKAWTRGTGGSGLVAHGFGKDTLAMTKEGYPVIQERLFEVVNVVHPELMTPVPYLANTPELPLQDDLLIFSTSQTFVQTLRSSQRNMAFLVAVSALVTSLKPIVDRFSVATGWVLVGVGITAAFISVMSVVFGWTLAWIEANAAKHRQTNSNV